MSYRGVVVGRPVLDKHDDGGVERCLPERQFQRPTEIAVPGELTVPSFITGL